MYDAGLGTLVTYNPSAVLEDSTLEEVMQLLRREDIRHLPVVDSQRRIVGILSTLDVAHAVVPVAPPTNGHSATNGHATAPWDRCAREIMVQPVVTVDHQDSATTALSRMMEKRIHSVPVTEEQRLVGMITSTDFLREFSYGDCSAYRSPVAQFMHGTDAQVELSADLHEARTLMDTLGVEYMAVVTGGCPIGILSQRELRYAGDSAAANNGDGSCSGNNPSLAGRFLADVPTVRPTDTLGEAVGHMLEHSSPAIAVVERNHRMAGLITQDDILQAITAELGSAA